MDIGYNGGVEISPLKARLKAARTCVEPPVEIDVCDWLKAEVTNIKPSQHMV